MKHPKSNRAAKRAHRAKLLAEVRATLNKNHVQPEQQDHTTPVAEEEQVSEPPVRGLSKEAPDGGDTPPELPTAESAKVAPAKRTRATAKRKSSKRSGGSK